MPAAKKARTSAPKTARGAAKRPASKGPSRKPAAQGRTPKTSPRNRLPSAAAAKPRLLSGDNPQIPKGHGDAPVQAYIAAIPDWKRGVTAWLDGVVTRSVPGVRKAVKWNSPLYGAPGRDDWFLGIHMFTHYVKVAFFRGTDLKPMPPGESKQKTVRYLDIRVDDKPDEALVASWVRQAAGGEGQRM